jgi:hypothetical protein
MRRTIEWPPRVVGGRLAMTPDPDTDPADPGLSLRQIVRLSCLPGRSTNAFNDADRLGVDDATWSAQNSAGEATMREGIVRQFARLERERRARLVELSFTRSRTGELGVRVSYEDLESGTRQEMEASLGNG